MVLFAICSLTIKHIVFIREDKNDIEALNFIPSYSRLLDIWVYVP